MSENRREIRVHTNVQRIFRGQQQQQQQQQKIQSNDKIGEKKQVDRCVFAWSDGSNGNGTHNKIHTSTTNIYVKRNVRAIAI